ncbi:sulfur carrier protein ThiS [Lentibacillus cibarius]|uniref:Sulfur carrier protein ThiS n=1 Tax=Lentibacillus cibarius TaxID=2583219 RepID=A0A549YL84_9BACI|nr:sulfur carrier protein ThiS [Lentibacillus cibarius]TMN20743.1 sulfur carrier protein ThiS [Lentibacillus cibarius]TRM12638.1 sulfur carrier protein ThiS [Lentibacillus cibarius]
MKLNVNGNEIHVPETVKTIEDVKLHLNITNPGVIVEHNGDILEKSTHVDKQITDGDKIEFVQFVGGG